MKKCRKFFKKDEAMQAILFAQSVKGKVYNKGTEEYMLELLFDDKVFGNQGNEYVVVWKEESN